MTKPAVKGHRIASLTVIQLQYYKTCAKIDIKLVIKKVFVFWLEISKAVIYNLQILNRE